MILRNTLNGLQPRTREDAARDPYDWLQPVPRKPKRSLRWDLLTVLVLGVLIGAGLVMGAAK